jgi:YggT family protein
MHLLINFLTITLNIYSILLLVRIMLSWFSLSQGGRLLELLSRVTDPYLGWWRQNLNLRLGYIDFSPVAAIAFLSMVQNIMFTISRSMNTGAGRITFSYILAVALASIWSAVSFIIIFFLIIIILRMIAYFTNRNIQSVFWGTIDSISRPLLYRINRLIFGNRLTSYTKSIIFSALFLAGVRIGGGYLIKLICDLLTRTPV